MSLEDGSSHHVLVVDDEETQRTVLGGFLKKRGLRVTTAGSVDEALKVAGQHVLDLVLTDLRMPGRTGLDLLDEIKRLSPDVPLIVMTAFGTVQNAVDAMKRGASDYLTKPINLDELEVLVARTLERRALESENRELRQLLASRYRLEGLETNNARMAQAINTAARAAASRATILIRGESGTGKEVLARAIHLASPRARGPFVAVNMAALPDTLVESELFGHERGAFTGADREHRGRFEQADRGTLLLDEVGDLPRGTQVKLLRVLQEQVLDKLGGSRPVKIDVRVIAATNRDLEGLIREGGFREDLYYRLNVVTIDLPPLRDRREDLPLLVDAFLQRYANEGRGVRSVSREAMDALTKYAYPGNVRELENIVHRATVLARGTVLTTSDLPPHVVGLKDEPVAAAAGDASDGTFVQRVAAFEKRLILDALAREQGVQTRAARALEMSERHLRYKLKKYGIDSGAERD